MKGMPIEAFYKNALNVSFPSQGLLTAAYLYHEFHLPVFILGVLPAFVTLLVVAVEIATHKGARGRTLVLFMLHYGMYALIGYMLTLQFYDEDLLGRKLALMETGFVQSPVL